MTPKPATEEAMISSKIPNPQATIRALDGHLVEVQPRGRRQPPHRGVIRGAGEKGFSLDLSDGIGGRVIFAYYEVLSVKDLGQHLEEIPQWELDLLRRQQEERDTEDCRRCGSPNPPWSAPSPLWNHVMRGNDIGGEEPFDGIICPRCFIQLAETAGVAELWRLYPQRVNVELTTTTPDGRVWDPDAWLWVDPA